MDLFATDSFFFTPKGPQFSGAERIYYRTASLREIAAYNRAEQRLVDRYRGTASIKDRLIEKGWTSEEHDAFLAQKYEDIPDGEEGEQARREYFDRADAYRRAKTVDDLPTEDDHSHKIDIALRCIERIEGFTAGEMELVWSDDGCWSKLAKLARLSSESPHAGRQFFLERLGAGQDLTINLTLLASKIVTGITESEGND